MFCDGTPPFTLGALYLPLQSTAAKPPAWERLVDRNSDRELHSASSYTLLAKLIGQLPDYDHATGGDAFGQKNYRHVPEDGNGQLLMSARAADERR